MPPTSRMAAEAAEIPACVARQRAEHRARFAEIGTVLARLDPPLVATLARGSSDHAATYLKYLVELATAIPVASIPPSIVSVWRRPLRLGGCACVAISQSGRSPDLVDALGAAADVGASCIAVVNEIESPLAEHARAVPIAAGPERSVAATKSFAGALAAVAGIVAAWRELDALDAALDALPEVLGRALARDWSAALAPLDDARSVYAIARGAGLAVAAEAALKLKETCRVHAEAYSAAEVLHGPLELGSSEMTVIAFAGVDAGRDSVLGAARRLAATGARVFVADPLGDGAAIEAAGARALEVARSAHPWLDPLSQIASFYPLAESLARRRGRDPDAPRELSKVTETR